MKLFAMVSVFLFHILLISISRFFFFFLHTLPMNFVAVSLSDGTVVSLIIHRLSFLSLMTMSGLFAFIALSMCTGISQSIVTTCQLSRFCKPYKSGNECILLTFCAGRCTLFSLTPDNLR